MRGSDQMYLTATISRRRSPPGACTTAVSPSSLPIKARAQGDLSENAEYEAANDRQGFIEGRSQEVEGKLSAAQIIDPTAVDAGGRVGFCAPVELEN
ncbi:MAG: hypothetical protein KBT18_11130, partial [Comamonas sp.]|nr:hypothetical protein [Candidatus Comamonas equi]